MLNKQKNKYSTVKGFSLVELMVSILIGLIILAGVIQVVVSSKSAYLNQEDMSYIQENARYAVRTLSLDIQNAGYWGCAGANPKTAMVAKVADEATETQIFSSLLPIQSFATQDEGGTFLSGDELWEPTGINGNYTKTAFVIRRGGGQERSVKSNQVADQTISVDSSERLNTGDFVAVVAADCERMGVVRVTGVSDGEISYGGGLCENGISIKPTIKGNGFSCDEGSIPQNQEAYLRGSTLMGFVAHAYYIEESGVLTDQPALKRRVLKGDNTIEEEIALGVEDMQLLYGVISDDADGNANALRYYTQTQMLAGGIDWARVNSVRLSLVFRSQARQAVSEDEPAQEFLGITYPKDGYMRKLVSTTVQLRNRT